MVEAVGFCRDHASVLASPSSDHDALVAMLVGAIDRLLAWMVDTDRCAERLAALFLSADRTCALCKFVGHQVSYHLHRALPADPRHRSRRLCFPHYRDAVFELDSAALPGLIAAELELLERVADRSSPSRTAHPSALALADPALGWALRVIAGEPTPADATPLDHRDEVFSAEERGCPVCIEIVRAEARWLAALRTAARVGPDFWTVFPTCPTHIRACVRLCDPDAARIAIAHATAVELEALEKGSVALERDRLERQAAARSVFYRRKSLGYILGRQRRMITDTPPCNACERMIVAQERALEDVLQSQARERPGRFGAVASTLCLKHFGAVYLLTPRGERQAALVAAQVSSLRDSRDQLTSTANGSQGQSRDAAVRQALRCWSTAMPRLEARRRGRNP